MRENLQQIIYMVWHDPAAVVGFLLIGIFAVLFIHLQLKMIKAGYKTSYNFIGKPFAAVGWDTPARYLKVCANHGWSPWPAYLLAPCLLLGIAALVFGLFRL